MSLTNDLHALADCWRGSLVTMHGRVPVTKLSELGSELFSRAKLTA
ncbi:hypothetical protein [Agrobacterium radiobacter]|nr:MULTISPECIES: hypothetical protein [Agrobacterium tumefaciens complex]NIB09207.1 hypothetical protein [Agrobacterium radiobacter]